jgi:hypothetical protein
MYTRNRGFQVVVNAHLSRLTMRRDGAGRLLLRGTPLAFVEVEVLPRSCADSVEKHSIARLRPASHLAG